MANIELVIKMPEEEYKRWKEDGEIDAVIVRDALINGTLLPKRHGRLIDADALISTICGNSCGCHLDECGYDNPCYSVTRISSASTIIGR